MSDTQVILDKDCYAFHCPHCQDWIQVGFNDVNCAIFRHAYFFYKSKEGGIIPTTMLNPHASKNVCETLLAEGKICGCGKPFRLVKEGDVYVAKICDYI